MTLTSAGQALLQQSIQAYQQRDFSFAEAGARQLLGEDPGQPDALQLLGLIAFDAGYTDQGLELLQGAITNQPDNPLFYINLGQSYMRLGHLEKALQQFEKALELQPNNLVALNMAGIINQEIRQPQKALEFFKQALKQNPGSYEIKYNLAVSLQKQQQFKEALHYLSQVLQAKPYHLDALNLRGLLRQELGQIDKAQTDFQNVISSDTQHAEAHFNLGSLMILRAQLPEAWEEYEWRWDCPGNERKTFGLPRWQGQALMPEENLLVHADAGFGDTLQFVRYLLDDSLPAPQIVLRCQHSLVQLFQEQNWPFQIISDQHPIPEKLSYEIPLLSFPALRQTTLTTIPHAEPYLKAPSHRPQLPAIASEACLRVGFVWAGSPDNAIDLKRSCELRRFIKLMSMFPNIFWVSLQKSPVAQELSLHTLPSGFWNADKELNSFKDTAAVISQLDLIIAVDTSVVHLAGALGKPVWILLPMIPDWRWFLERLDSPWYSKARLFRQTERNNWKQVFKQVHQALSTLTKI